METITVPESYGNWLKKLERAEKFAVTMATRLSDEAGQPCVVVHTPVRPSLTMVGFEVDFEGTLSGTITLPLQEVQWKPLLDQLSFALRWYREKKEQAAPVAVE